MRERLVVLGGSSPFTAAFVDALADADEAFPVFEMVLNGRDTGRLDRIATYARSQLGPRGWRITAEPSLKRALAGAKCVVHQIRYGGLEGRAEDEALALRFGLPPDETLGPAAVNAVLRTVDPLRATAALIVEHSPDAWVLNMTNPLSLTTSLLRDAGVRRCVGLCELPRVTAMRAAAVLGVPFEGLSWSYVGLNHRGFIVALTYGGADRIPDLVERLKGADFEGVPANEIARLSAVPTKYFRLFGPGVALEPGRAAFLASLRDRIREELERRPDRSPPSLRERYLEWYPESVVPMIAALSSAVASVHVVNVNVDGDADAGLTREVHARVSRDGIQPLPPLVPGGEVTRWLDRFEQHERALLAATRSPSLPSIRAAMEADPLVPEHLIEVLARTLWESRPMTTRSV